MILYFPTTHPLVLRTNASLLRVLVSVTRGMDVEGSERTVQEPETCILFNWYKTYPNRGAGVWKGWGWRLGRVVVFSSDQEVLIDVLTEI